MNNKNIFNRYCELLDKVSFLEKNEELFDISKIIVDFLNLIPIRTATIVTNFIEFCKEYSQPINFCLYNLRKLLNRPIILDKKSIKINNISKEETINSFISYFEKYIICSKCSSKETYTLKQLNQYRFFCSACHHCRTISQ